MLSRIVQLMARMIALLCIAITGYLFGEPSPETVESITSYSTEIAVAVVGFGALLFDLLIHKVETGGFLKKAGEENPKPKSPNSLNLPLLILALVPALALAGCGTDPAFLASSQNYYGTVGAYVYDQVEKDPDLPPEDKELYILRHESYGKVLEAKQKTLFP